MAPSRRKPLPKKKAARSNPAPAAAFLDPLEVLGRISREIVSEKSLDSVLKRISAKTVKYFPADACSIMLLDTVSRDLIFKEASGLTQWEMDHIRFKTGEGIAGWVAEHRRPALVEDVSEDPRFLAHPDQQTVIRSLLCVPMLAGDRVLGVVSLTNRKKVAAFGHDHQRLLTLISGQISLDLENHRLQEMAVSDGLTGLYNQKYLKKRLAEEISCAKRYREELSIAMIDLDHFKDINDTHGHLVGDAVLAGLGAFLRRNTRQSDIVARYGGEEFVTLLTRTGKPGAMVITERLRELVAQFGVMTAKGTIKFTVSAGVACFPEDGGDADALIEASDRALYAAKGAGRNRVAMAERQEAK